MRQPGHERPPLRWGFVVFVLVLAAICVGLGAWQLVRLGEKEALIARIAERAHEPSIALPPLKEWVGFDPEVWDYRHVALSGTLRNDETILVFTALSEPRGVEEGPGYWVLAPLVLEGGGVVYVNRGFIPQMMKSAFADGGPDGGGAVSLTGILRQPEAANAFTPGTDRAERIDYIRDPARFAAISDKALAPVLPAYLDQDAGAKGQLPQGGETVFDIPNRHLEYALTWFGLAGVALVMLASWLVARLRK